MLQDTIEPRGFSYGIDKIKSELPPEYVTDFETNASGLSDSARYLLGCHYRRKTRFEPYLEMMSDVAYLERRSVEGASFWNVDLDGTGRHW